MPRPRRAVPCLPTAEQKRACKSLGSWERSFGFIALQEEKPRTKKTRRTLWGYSFLPLPPPLPSPSLLLPFTSLSLLLPLSSSPSRHPTFL
uniref:Macaca fascicularis brain cDNA, clone: QbsB-10836 n=1 Tax=Macaca fascicularis TaxID=9541 RepID=I7GHZ4_MACFA|nr:unnamed protein product [Macaca fascicularis]